MNLIMKQTVFVILLFFPLIITTESIWNRLVLFRGKLKASDYTYSEGQFQNSQLALRSYTLSLNSDQSVEFILEAYEGIKEMVFTGSAVSIKECHQLLTNHYKISSDLSKDFNGSLVFKAGWGITLTYHIQVTSIGLNLQRAQIRYEYLCFILLIAFGVAGVTIFSLSDKKRNKILYNLKKRSHPAVLLVIIYKLLIVAACFMLFGYGCVFEVAIWWIFLLYGTYLFCLSPCIIHALYLSSAAQKGLQESQFYTSKSQKIKSSIVFGAIISVFVAFFISLMIQKGILYFYLISLNTIGIYVHSIKIRQFAYGPLIMYDILLTFILSIISLYLPVAGFGIISYKEMLLFWNYFIFVFVFGMILMKKLIKKQIVSDSHVQIEAQSIQQAKIPHSLQMIQD